MKKSIKLYSLGVLLALPTLVSAQAPARAADTTKEEAFIGFNWQLGESFIPLLEIGHRQADVDSDGDVEGFGASVSFNLMPLGIDKVVVKGINGTADAQTEFGAGYSFTAKEPIGVLGAQGDHLHGEINLGPSLAPNINLGINSISDYQKINHEYYR